MCYSTNIRLEDEERVAELAEKLAKLDHDLNPTVGHGFQQCNVFRAATSSMGLGGVDLHLAP